MGRGHARDTFFLPHDTSEHPFGKDQNIRRETQTCNDPVPIYSLLHSHQSIRLITLRASFTCSAAVSFRLNKHWSMSPRPHDPSLSQTESHSPILKPNDACSIKILIVPARNPAIWRHFLVLLWSRVSFSWHFKLCSPLLNVASHAEILICSWYKIKVNCHPARGVSHCVSYSHEKLPDKCDESGLPACSSPIQRCQGPYGPLVTMRANKPLRQLCKKNFTFC